MRLGKNVVIVGGTGFIGREVAYALGEAGYQVTFLVRRPERYRDLMLLPNARVRQWQLEQLEALLAGQDILVHLVVDQSDSLEALPPSEFVSHVQKLQRAATRAGIRRVIHLSYVEADANTSDGWCRSLAEMEAAMHGINTAAVTTLRASLLIGEQDDITRCYFAQAKRHGWMPVYQAEMRVQPLWVQDFARLVVKILRNRDSFGQRWTAVGPDTLTLRDLASEVGELTRGVEPYIFEVGALSARMLMALGPLAPESLHPSQLVTLQGDRVAETEAGEFEARYGFVPTDVEVALASYITPHDVRHRYNFYRKEAGRPLEELPREWL